MASQDRPITARAPHVGRLFRNLLLAGIAGFAVGCAISRPRSNAGVPQPARPVDLNRYLGRWYEMARYDSWFEHDDEAVTADYALRTDGLIQVINTSRRDDASRQVRVARGRARAVEGSGNAKLKVSFFGPFFLGNYWVLDHAEDYSWSIVGEPSGRYLWILTREARPDPARRAELVGRTQAFGYDTSRLHFTRQPASDSVPAQA
jgi:apolipoprotein D and lipocalin family protein